MSDTNDVIYSRNLSLFTLKGEIAVHFLDGNVIEGNFATQDAFNIFLTIDDEPVMIPRSQIRFIMGRQGQQIEKDTSQDSFLAAQPIQGETVPTSRSDTEEYRVVSPPPEGDEATYVLPLDTADGTDQAPIVAKADDEDEDKSEDTLVLYPDIDQSSAADDDDDGTVVLYSGEDQVPASADDTDDDGAFVLEPLAEELSEETSPIPPDSESEDLDMTVLLDDDSASPAEELEGEERTVVLDALEELEPGEDELTVVLGEQQEETEISASLVCTSGPHAGEVLKLKSGIVTLGRSSDNSFVLSNDKEISRHHAIVLHESGKFVVQDQNSLNGTFVNNEPVTAPRYLEDGDLILVGLSVLKYQEEE